MKNFILILIWSVVVFGAGWFLNEHLKPQQQIEIIQGSIHDDHPVVDPDKLKISELKRLVNCYANQAAHLELFLISENIIRAESGLCERKWSRDITVKTKPKQNYISSGALYPVGVYVSYYRRIGSVAIGGGVQYQDKPSLNIGILYGW